MWPTLFSLGPITLHTYGLMVALGVVAGYHLSRKQYLLSHLGSAEQFDSLFYVVLFSAIVGARLLYFTLHEPKTLILNPLSFFKVWEGGLVFIGGFIAVILALCVYTHFKKISFLLLTDLFAPALPFAQALGRLGCFAAGCCYGRETKSFFSVTFTNPESLAPIGIPLIPTQLLMSFGDIVIGVILFLYGTYQPSRTLGRRTALYLILYGLFRFFIEYLRGDDRGHMVFGFEPSQFVAIQLIIIGFSLMFWPKRSSLK